MLSSLILAGLLSICTASPTPSAICSQTSRGPIVEIQNGTLEGSYNSHFEQEFFLGVPFAQAPVGDFRLRKPLPPLPWNGTKVANEYGASCIGNSLGLVGFSQNLTGPMSEDCLSINIIRPAGVSKGAKLPVLVWVYGGSWLEGSSSDPRYNGSFLVDSSVQMETPIIFASFNYRLGVFGTLAGDAMEKEGLTNLLLHDQRQALAWIQDNIESFGGDASHVTLMGESAGAGSIGFQILAYGGRDDGLFHAAILESGGPFSPYAFANSTQRQAHFESVLKTAGCSGIEDSLACLRSAPVDLLKEASAQSQPYFTIDGDLLPEHSSKLLREGRFVKVPLLIGVNRNEGTSFLDTSRPQNTDADFLSFVKGAIGDFAVPDDVLQTWLEAYQGEVDNPSGGGLGTVLANPGPKYGSGYGRATLWLGDFLLGAGRRYTNQVWANNGIPSYSFLFDTVPASINATTLGATHTQELAFVFGNRDGVGWDFDPYPAEPILREKYQHFADTVGRMWASFAATGSPNFHKVPDVEVEWPVYSNDEPTNIVLSAVDGISIQSDTWRAEAMSLFDNTRLDLGRRQEIE